MIMVRAEWDGVSLEFDGLWKSKQAPEVAGLLNVALQAEPSGPDEPDRAEYAIAKAKERAPNLSVTWLRTVPTEAEDDTEVIY